MKAPKNSKAIEQALHLLAENYAFKVNRSDILINGNTETKAGAALGGGAVRRVYTSNEVEVFGLFIRLSNE